MPIREKSFRIGCGRYLQESGILSNLGEEILRLGNAPLIIGGHTALRLTRSQIESSVSAVCQHYRIEVHTGTCNDEDARAFAALASSEHLDVIVGVGGGVMMDFAKMIARVASLPIINVPTSSATCAAYTPLSVMYTKQGRTVGTTHHEREVDAVLADTAAISTQPPRLLLAGVFDAMAKYLEIRHRYQGENEDYPIGLDYAYTLSERSFRVLSEKTDACLSDIKDGVISDTVEEVVFTTIAATGVISGIARGSNQCALAHKFYEITRALFADSTKHYLHGEIVGIGLLLQNHYNNEAARNDELIALMRKHAMPYRVSDLGIERTEDNLCEYLNRIKNSSAINKENRDECEKLALALRYLWNIE